MSIKQNNKTQSYIRFNLSNILGLSEEQVRMLAQNQDRLRGGVGQTYFNGRNAGTESGGTDPTCTECGGGGSGGGGGGSGGGGGGSGGGGGVVFPCVSENCVTLEQAAEMTANGETPCCIKDGKDCETGQDIPICLTDNCGDYGKGCTPPPYGECGTFLVFVTNPTDYDFSTLTTIESLEAQLNSVVEQALQQGIEKIKNSSPNCSSLGEKRVYREGSATLKCNGETTNINYTAMLQQRVENSSGGFCGFAYGGVAYKQGGGTQEEYNKALQNWTKPSGKYFKGGKFYDACGIEPAECITVCDENGNQYKICANNGKPKVTPVA